MANYNAPINTREDFATAVLTDLGAPITPNNIGTMLNWMAAENPVNNWAPRNNPLNNGLGSGGGSGLGSYANLGVAAQEVAANLSAGDYGYPAAKAVLMSNGPDDSFRSAIAASSWAGSHYAGSDYLQGVTTGAASPNIAGAASSTGAAASPGDPSAQTPATPTRTATVNGQVVTGTDAQIAADVEAQQQLQNYGLGDLAGWAWGEITSGADNNQILLDMMNTPQFAQRFPGIIAQENYNKANPNNPVPVITVDQYQQYETYAYQQAQAAGIPPGIVNSALIGQLIAGNVSQAEFSQRLGDAVALAINSTPQDIAQFNQYFGVQDKVNEPFTTGISQYGGGPGSTPPGHGSLTTGQIAALALDPNIAEPIIKQQILAAQVGGGAATAGVAGVSSQEAIAIAQSNPGLTQGGINSAAANVAPYANLENARPGMGGEAAQGTITGDQLIGTQLLPTASNLRQLQTAEEVAAQPFKGGGGYVSNSKGTTAGSSSSTGAGQ